MMKRKLLLSIMVLTLLLAGCAQPSPPTPTVVAPAPTATTESIQEPITSFEGGPCPFDVPEGAPVECGFVIVPEDHNDPAGPTIRLAAAILRDQGEEHQPDPVILLAGGPGEKTVANALNIMQVFAPTLPNRDFVIFDQRGVGLSEPALECPEWEQSLFDTLDETDPEVMARTNFEALLACRDRLVSEGYNLSLYNNVQNAADVNAIRIALGYDQVNLYGGSYGSLLAQTTARDYPEAIRSMAIWSVLPMEKSVFVDATTATANAVLHLLNVCAEDVTCNRAFPDLQQVLFEVIDRLNDEQVTITVTNPVDGQSYQASLSGDAVFGNLVVFLYQTHLIPALPQAILDVYNGDYGLMSQLIGQNLALFKASSRGMTYSVICTDDLIGRKPEDILELKATLPNQFTGRIDPEVALEYGIFGVCESWPVEEAAPWVKEPLVSDIPTLLLEGEFDPVTPSEYAQLVAENLSNSYFFELPGIGHFIITNECARSIAGAFLDNPNIIPDTKCIDEMTGVVFAVPGEAVELVLEPFIDDERGFSGILPVGWEEIAPANLLRKSDVLDPTYFVLEASSGTAAELFANLAGQLGLEPELEPIASAEIGNFTWDFYTFERRGHPADLAITEDGEKAYFVFMISAAEEHDALYEQLFLPAVEAMAPLE